MGKLAERIVAAEAELIATKDTLTTVSDALIEAPEDEALMAQVDELTESVDSQTKTLAALQKAEKALATRARPPEETVTAPNIAPNLRTFKDIKKGGELMWKRATAKLIAHIEKKPLEQVFEERYGDDERVKATHDYTQVVLKTSVAPAMTTVPAWAGALVREDTRGFMETVAEESVAAALAAQTQSLDFAGANSIKIPYENPLAANPTEPAWVGEGGVIPLTSFSFGSLTLTPNKLAAITTMTREIVDRSTPAIEGIVQNLLRKAYSKVLDHALLTPAFAAVPNVRPASLYNGVAPLPGAGTTPDDNVRADVLALLSALTAAGLGQKPVLIGNNLDFLSAGMMVNAMNEFIYRADLNAGNLLGIGRISSGHVPLHQLGLVDAAYIAMGLGAIDFDVSDVATVTEANADTTAPTQANYGAAGAVGAEGGRVAVAGGIPVAGGSGTGMAGVTARSLWQTYSVGIRMVSELSWGKLNAAAAQFIADTDWGTAP